jgi:glycosyltransferase involved in cell wall biosynthesis
MKISIALATYNGEKFISDQLDSFCNQNKLPDELIVSDDLSSDSTMIILKKFAKQAPFKVNIYQNKSNLGYARNFNNALTKTTGDLVFLSDQDDIWYKNKIKTISERALKSESLFFINNAEIVNEHLKTSGFNKFDQIKSLGGDKSKFVMGCCAAIKRDLLDIALPIHESFKAHDTWLAWYAQFLDLYEVDNSILQFYRRHGANESNYIANNLHKISKNNLFLNRIKNINKDYLSESRSQIQIFHKDAQKKLARISLSDDSINQERMKKIIFGISNKLNLIDTRINFASSFFLVRIYKGINFYLKGGYKSFSGLKSLIKDIFIKK